MKTVFVLDHYTEDAYNVGGASVTTNEPSKKLDVSNGDRSIAIGKMSRENAVGSETSDKNATCISENLYLECGGSVASPGNSVFEGLTTKAGVADELAGGHYRGLVTRPDL